MAAHPCISYPCPLCYPDRFNAQPVYALPPTPTFTPQGCICPPKSEKTCESISCPRQDPLQEDTEREAVKTHAEWVKYFRSIGMDNGDIWHLMHGLYALKLVALTNGDSRA